MLVETAKALDWMEQAACKGLEELFHFEGHPRKQENLRKIRQAKAICHSCPVFNKCDEWSAEHIWYGCVIAGEVHGKYRRWANS
jgi:WhiB family redox-sensing transcriptional regulator